MNAVTTFEIDGAQAVFIKKTHAEGRHECCPMCEGLGTVPRFTVAHIARVVREHYGLSSTELFGDARSPLVAHPRQLAMYLCRKLTTQSYPCIARRFGRDHTTILHGVRQTEKRIADSKSYREEVERIMLKVVG